MVRIKEYIVVDARKLQITLQCNVINGVNYIFFDIGSFVIYSWWIVVGDTYYTGGCQHFQI